MKILGISFFIRTGLQAGHDIPYHKAVAKAFGINGWDYQILVGKYFTSSSESIFLPGLHLPPVIKMLEGRNYFPRLIKFFFVESWRFVVLFTNLGRHLWGKKRNFDAVFIETYSLSELIYTGFWVSVLHGKQFWVLYRFDKESLGPMRDDIPSFIGAPLYKLATRLLAKKLGGRLHLFSDSELLTSSLSSYFNLSLTTLPIPHISSLCHANDKVSRGGNPILWWPGRNDTSKGLECINRFIKGSAELACKVTLEVFEATRELAKHGDMVAVVEQPYILDDEDYFKLLRRADYVLLPYSPKRFKSSTSGIFVETVCCGTTPIVSKGTWMAYELANNGLEVLIFDPASENLASHLNRVMAMKGEIMPLIQSLRDKYLRFHGEKGFAETVKSAVLSSDKQNRIMRLLMYADPAFASSAGIERVAREFIGHCADGKRLQVTLFVARDIKPAASERYGGHDNIKIRSSIFSRRQLYILWGLFGIRTLGSLEKEHDVLFIPSHIHIPARTIKKVGVVHDLLDLICPPPGYIGRFVKPIVVRKFITSCSRLVAVSSYTKFDTVTRFGTDPGIIDVVYHGYDKALFNLRKEAFKFAGEVRVPYILYVGSLYSRRYASLIEAYSLLVKRFDIKHDLVLVGGRESTGKGGVSVREKINQHGLDDRVSIFHGLNDTDLANLMKNCDIFVYPSSFEGFGMPPLEAAACGKAVVVGNNTSLKELYGNAGITVDNVFDEQELAEKIYRLVGNPRLRREKEKASVELAKEFSWEKTYSQTLESLGKCIENEFSG